MAAFHHRPKRDTAQAVAGKPAQDSRKAQGHSPLHAPLDPNRPFGLGEARSTDSVATWGGRPISKWTRWGVWNEDGTIFTPTRVI